MGTEESLRVAEELCRTFEGLSTKPYLCPAGVATIGYGTTRYPDGRRVSLDDPEITPELARRWLRDDLRVKYMPSVGLASPNVLGHPLVLGALTDFVYNLGPGRYRASTLRRRIEAEDWDEAVVELKRWVRGGGRVLPGLVRRRLAEAMYLPAESE